MVALGFADLLREELNWTVEVPRGGQSFEV
jgi:hypothetical protein